MKKELPSDLDRFNWGAFFLGWIWAISMKNPLAFVLSFFLGVIGNYIIGVDGNRWAWQTRDFESVEEFIKVQEKWTKAGLSVFIISFTLSTLVTLAIVGLLIFFVSQGEPVNYFKL